MYHIIGENFFVPLASPNKTVYWECICKLFSVMDHQLSFGVERDVLVEELQYYFEQTQAADIKEDELSGKTARDKANWMIRKLEAYGWIDIETDKSYVQRVNFKEHAVKVVKTLLEITEGKRIEYQGYIYTIYTLVRTNTDNPGVVLLSIVENTDMLITGLKNLSSSIKNYIDELTKYRTPAEIMNVLFNDYIENIVDKAYHRLLTSDNVSKFRPEIIERLESKSRSPQYIEKASEDLAGIREISKEDARELAYHYIHQVLEAFHNMDDILSEINYKNTQYQRAAINRAKFYLIGGEDVRGQLKELLTDMSDRILADNMDLAGIYRIEYIDELIRLYSVSVIDEKSLYTPIEGKKTFTPSALIDEDVDLALRNDKLQRMMEKLARVLSPERVGAYVDQQLGDKKRMMASQLPLDTVEDYVKLIYIRLYGQRKNMEYSIVLHEDEKGKNDRERVNAPEKGNRFESNEQVRQKGYYFQDFEIVRKETK
ncbi:MAG: DUF5716 family protein [Lachnospiraceae bacterium]|nr:DUF5716 family protein [Lachnospiraceae bacterium]